MRILDFQSEPLFTLPYLNVGRGTKIRQEASLPLHHARVDRLPSGISAIVVTSDLQGRALLADQSQTVPPLLGEVVPSWLIGEVLPSLGVEDPKTVAALLAGDFYTVPLLDKRGGTGDVMAVWQAFRERFAWIAGVAGNHDLFGLSGRTHPPAHEASHFLDGEIVNLGGLRIAGLGGIIGKPTRPQRREQEHYLQTLKHLLQQSPDVLLMHEGPDGSASHQPGQAKIRDLLESQPPSLVIRGHKHWDEPVAHFPSGLQVLNVEARIVILTT